VLRIVRDGNIDHPERLGAFVNSVCANVAHEFMRAASLPNQDLESAPELVDVHADIHASLIREELGQEVRMALEQLSDKDRLLLRMIFYEERDKAEVCKSLGVTRASLRVLLHRAKLRLKERITGGGPRRRPRHDKHRRRIVATAQIL
jgi:RNA polymerase sigma-70 factor (ECF subfamily)